ncbi:MAG: ABC transporter ATP-binding protein [SAR202 cluster bacterium]|jgi:ATP-binding cassette subfamily B protein|nr:ABC transporter ATP-binding protein [SAR202 cluster bacterium]
MNILARILAIVFRHKWRLAGALTSMVGATSAYLTLPWLFGSAVDEIASIFDGGGVSDVAMIRIGIAILAASVIRGLLTFFQTFMGESLAQHVVYDLRNRYYDHIQNLSFGFHDKNHTGNLMSRAITDVEAIRMFCVGGVIRAPYFLVLFLATAIILLLRDWRLGLVSLGFMPLLAIVSAVIRLQLRRIWLRVQEEMAELNTVLQENMTGVRVVRAFAAEDQEKAKYDAASSAVSADMVKTARLQAMNASFMGFIYLVAIGLVLWYGGQRVIDGSLSPGELAQFLFYMQLLALPIRHAGMLVNNFARAFSAGQRLFEIMDYRSDVQEAPGASDLPMVRGHVRFKDVSLRYGDGPLVVKDIEIDAKPGTLVALLGAPGSGKSSLVHLLPRFYDVAAGLITIDGVDIKETTLKSLRRNIGIVQQDVFLFTASLSENIAYGRPSATMDEIVAAAKVAQMHDFIEDLEEGYDTKIGERGSTLSGGQRQRMSIARAVLLDPPVLILDDATASVDANTEERIRKAMESVMSGRTTFVIAHRLSTLFKADEILVMDEGRIVERGTHASLLAHGGVYRRIYDLQLRPQEEVMMEFDVPDLVHRHGENT